MSQALFGSPPLRLRTFSYGMSTLSYKEKVKKAMDGSAGSAFMSNLVYLEVEEP